MRSDVRLGRLRRIAFAATGLLAGIGVTGQSLAPATAQTYSYSQPYSSSQPYPNTTTPNYSYPQSNTATPSYQQPYYNYYNQSPSGGYGYGSTWSGSGWATPYYSWGWPLVGALVVGPRLLLGLAWRLGLGRLARGLGLRPCRLGRMAWRLGRW